MSWQDLNTIKEKGELGIDTTNNKNYQVTAEDSTKNSSVQVLHITRKLDTGDLQDVPITVSHFAACILYHIVTVVSLKKLSYHVSNCFLETQFFSFLISLLF